MDESLMTRWRKRVGGLKGMIISFGIAFCITVFFVEWLSSPRPWHKNHNLGYSSFIRPRMEGTAVELYAEDIWRNGRRTLKTAFDPSTCTIKYLDKKLVRWSEVECVAEDERGRRWQYTTRYSDNFTVAFFMPFFVDTGPTRELKIISSNSRR